ncbi:MAG: hypothetical protein AB7L13_17630 [Acidimicrobiia bacterium]
MAKPTPLAAESLEKLAGFPLRIAPSLIVAEHAGTAPHVALAPGGAAYSIDWWEDQDYTKRGFWVHFSVRRENVPSRTNDASRDAGSSTFVVNGSRALLTSGIDGQSIGWSWGDTYRIELFVTPVDDQRINCGELLTIALSVSPI